MAKRKTRVLFIVPGLAFGGAETQLITLANGLDADRFEKYLFSFESAQDLCPRIAPDVQYVHRQRRKKVDWHVVRALAELIDAQAVDVVHCTLQFALLMGWLAVKQARRKPALVVAVHTTVNRNRKDEVFDWTIYQWLMRSCAKIIFVCKAQQHHWLGKFPGLRPRAGVVYNGIDTARYSGAAHADAGARLRADLSIPPNAPLACNIAQFRPEKGHHNLIAAFASVVEKLPGAHLALAGEGRTRVAVERQVRDLGLLDKVHFLGLQQDVRPLLAAADVTVMASVAVETFSIAMLESLAMGVPVVGTNMGGTREAVLDGDTGLLVPPDDIARLASAMVSLMNDLPLAREYGARGATLVRTHFDLQGMVSGTAALIEQVTPSFDRGVEYERQ